MIQLDWRKCSRDRHWCSLNDLHLTMKTKGVYVIWHEGAPSRVVYVGQGDVAERLACHRREEDILSYAKFGSLRVTWAPSPESQCDGIECYLADTLHPLIERAHPNVLPIAVNSPWETEGIMVNNPAGHNNHRTPGESPWYRNPSDNRDFGHVLAESVVNGTKSV